MAEKNVLKKMTRIIATTAIALSMVSTTWAEDAPPTAPTEDHQDMSGGAIAAAVVSDIIYIPGKATLCATSGLIWFVGMTITAGTAYRPMGDFVHDTCTGKWVITGHDFMEPAQEP